MKQWLERKNIFKGALMSWQKEFDKIGIDGAVRP